MAEKLIITDTGIGMSEEDMITNLGTLAKSGTSDFIAKAESGVDSGNLIGSFGLGFYSSFLVADEVQVASLPPKTEKNPTPQQYVFSSRSDENSFETYPDPRGNTLGWGTEITLTLRSDAKDYLETDQIKELVAKHSSFSTIFPIYLFVTEEEERIVEDEEDPAEKAEKAEKTASKLDKLEDDDAEAALVEDDEEEELEIESEPQKIMVMVDKWSQLNAHPPLWMRDPKSISDEEYIEFYKATFKEHEDPLAWHHFHGDSGSGVSFKAIIYIPGSLDREFWNKPEPEKNLRLMVKRVFITNDLGDDGIGKWASWLKVIIDADDLPLNVSRESLQNNKFIKQIKQIVMKRLIQLFSQIAEKDTEKYERINRIYGNAIKLGALENEKDKYKLAGLLRFATNQRNFTSLDEYASQRRKGQRQIYYLAAIGQKPEQIAKSVFIEKLTARGYECFLMFDPLDEFLLTSLRGWEGLDFQDAAKKGLTFGDEAENEDEKEQLEGLTIKFTPLLNYIKGQVGDLVREVVVSNRLVQSPCAIVAEAHGYSANMEKLMNAQNTKKSMQFMHDFAKKQKVLEINPYSPLTEGLLKRVNHLDFDNEAREVDEEAEAELKEVTSILIDGALVRSGFDVSDSNTFFERIDQVLRRSLGVSEVAKPEVFIIPAPPVADEPVHKEKDREREARKKAFEDSQDAQKPLFDIPDDLKDKIKVEVEEIPDDEDDYGNKIVGHDEL